MRTNRRNHRISTAALLLAAPLGLVAAVTCAASPSSSFTASSAGAGGAGSGEGGSHNAGGSRNAGSTGGASATSGAAASAAAGSLFDAAQGAGAGTGGGSGACPQCSANLQNVIDCKGNVIKTCAAGMACAAGACVANPCNVASAAQSTYGCEYWAVDVFSVFIAPNACYAAYVTNTWSVPVHISVDYLGKQLNVAQFARIPTGQGTAIKYAPYSTAAGLAPGEVAILFLAQATGEPGSPFGQACPTGVTTAVSVDPTVHGTGSGNAFHITTDGPVVAYQIFPYGGGTAAITSASLLLPTSAWDVNYIAVNAYATTMESNNSGLPILDILAAEDATQVTISPVNAIEAGPGVGGTPMGQPITYSLNRGQYVQFSQAAELTGSAILATKPVAVFGGSSCMNIPVDVSACDTGDQQIPPVRALGNEYAAVRYRGRDNQPDESVPWRLVGAVDGTTLTYTPSAPQGAPTTLSKGQLAEIDSPGPFLVASQDTQHPFYISAHMTGGDNFDGEGDPDFVNIVPTSQYLDSYTFFTDPTYPETNLVLVRAAGASGFEDVTLDCAGVLTGWMPLGAYEYTRVDLVTGNFQGVNGCNNGSHYISSKAPFAVTVWGWGSLATFPLSTQYVSYAYPAGAGVKPVNTTVVTPVTIQ